jgi:hypothetical protein
MNTFFFTKMSRDQRGAGTLKGILILVVIVVLLPLLIVGFYEGRKAYWDGQVRELCAKDGGIKVYETVMLPADKFNQWGQPNFYKPTLKENALGPEFVFTYASNYLRQGGPDVWRTHIAIARRADMKTLGESTSYSRRGGDVPGPWHESSFGCPDDRGDVPLLTRVFQH